MAEVVNLRLARKAKARGVAEDMAAANRARFGATKAERAASVAEQERAVRALDGAKCQD